MVMILLGLCTSCSTSYVTAVVITSAFIILSSNKIQSGDFLVPAYVVVLDNGR